MSDQQWIAEAQRALDLRLRGVVLPPELSPVVARAQAPDADRAAVALALAMVDALRERDAVADTLRSDVVGAAKLAVVEQMRKERDDAFAALRPAFITSVVALLAALATVAGLWFLGALRSDVECGAGTARVGNVCEASLLEECGAGTVPSDGHCVALAMFCDEGTVFDGDQCVRMVDCGSGTVETNGICVPSCMPGTELRDGACRLSATACGEGTRLDEATARCVRASH